MHNLANQYGRAAIEEDGGGSIIIPRVLKCRAALQIINLITTMNERQHYWFLLPRKVSMVCVAWSFYELGVSSSRCYIVYSWMTYMLCDAVGVSRRKRL